MRYQDRPQETLLHTKKCVTEAAGADAAKPAVGRGAKPIAHPQGLRRPGSGRDAVIRGSWELSQDLFPPNPSSG